MLKTFCHWGLSVKSDWRQARYFLTKSPAVASSPASPRTKQFIRRRGGEVGNGRGDLNNKKVGRLSERGRSKKIRRKAEGGTV